jgi:phosphoribosylanthranilate isomerase
LSGGIGIENIQSALQLKHPKMFGIDFNSKLEIETAVKSTEITEQIIKKIRANE